MELHNHIVVLTVTDDKRAMALTLDFQGQISIIGSISKTIFRLPWNEKQTYKTCNVFLYFPGFTVHNEQYSWIWKYDNECNLKSST